MVKIANEIQIDTYAFIMLEKKTWVQMSMMSKEDE